MKQNPTIHQSTNFYEQPPRLSLANYMSTSTPNEPYVPDLYRESSLENTPKDQLHKKWKIQASTYRKKSQNNKKINEDHKPDPLSDFKALNIKIENYSLADKEIPLNPKNLQSPGNFFF